MTLGLRIQRVKHQSSEVTREPIHISAREGEAPAEP